MTNTDILNNLTVLVVEDEPDSQLLAELLLKHYGAQVVLATNGAEGLLKLDAHPNIDFVISDISMPVMDGWVFIETVKKNATLSQIPIIALTAHAMDGDRDKVITAGFNDYLSKPINPRTFITDLLKALSEIPSMATKLDVED